MKNINFVNADELNTIEEYAASLITGAFSLKTLEAYQLSAYKKGILDEDEIELSKTICWEIKKLLVMFQSQTNNILDRSELKEEDILAQVRQVMPDVKPRSKKEIKDSLSKTNVS